MKSRRKEFAESWAERRMAEPIIAAVRKEEAEGYAERRMASSTISAAIRGRDENRLDRAKESLSGIGKDISGMGGKIAKLRKGIFEKPKKIKSIVRTPTRATIVINQPVYTKDKNRFFKDAINEERRQLFFK